MSNENLKIICELSSLLAAVSLLLVTASLKLTTLFPRSMSSGWGACVAPIAAPHTSAFALLQSISTWLLSPAQKKPCVVKHPPLEPQKVGTP